MAKTKKKVETFDKKNEASINLGQVSIRFEFTGQLSDSKKEQITDKSIKALQQILNDLR